MDEMHEGGCACGQVRFTVRGALNAVGGCHCSQCRKQTGLYLASVTLDDDAIAWSGLENATQYRSSADALRVFCTTCGSALFWKADASSTTSILAGAFDMPSGLKIGYHIYCADKGDFYGIDDGMPQYAQSNS